MTERRSIFRGQEVLYSLPLLLDGELTIVGVDNRWEELFGYPVEDTLGQQFASYLESESANVFTESIVESSEDSSGRGTLLLTICGVHGEQYPIELSATRMRVLEPASTQYQCSITGFSSNQDENSDVKNFGLQGVLDQIFQHAPLLMSVSTIEDGLYLMVNDSYLRRTGYTREEVIGRTSTEIGFITQEDRGRLKNQLLHEGKVREMPLHLTRADGTDLHCLYSADLITIDNQKLLLSYALDITENIQDKANLLKNAESLAAIFDSVPIFLGLINEDGTVDRINRSGAEMTKTDQHSAQGMSRGEVLSCIHAFYGEGCGVNPDCATCPVRSKVMMTFTSGKKGEEEELEMTRREDGVEKLYHFLASTTPLYIRDELKVLLSLTDITDSKQLELEKNVLRRQLFQSQKLESIGRLAGGVAHDLNNLLVPILGYAEMMSEDMGEVDPKKDSARQIVEAGRRAGDLLKQLLAFSRKQKLSLKVFNFNELLTGFEKLLRRALREDISMQMNCQDGLLNVRGDRGQLEQVVMNLVVNAQDAMPDGGQLTIETSLVTLFAPETPTWESFVPGEHVRLRITDSGVGMEQQVVERIFEPFFTTKPSDKGTGLGLSTVHGIVVQHGGMVSVSSQPGRGSCFQILLPEANSKVDEIVERSEVDHSVNSGSILVVEDDDRLRELLVRVLGRRGFTVRQSMNAEEALQLLGENEMVFDLLLTDVVMPGMNGRELYEQVQQQFPEMKVLYMSGHDRDILSRRGIEEGTVQLIEKPFSINTLVKRIQEVFERS